MMKPSWVNLSTTQRDELHNLVSSPGWCLLTPGPSGVFVHHGTWAGRTRAAPPGFWEEIERSGIGDYFRANPPHGFSSGTLAQLPKGDRGAFDAVVRQIRLREDSKPVVRKGPP